MLRSLNGKGIIWVASYPRSGTTWVRMALFNLFKIMSGSQMPAHLSALNDFSPWDAKFPQYKNYLRGEYHKLPPGMLCAAHFHAQQDVARDRPGPVFVKTHWPLGKLRGYNTHDLSVSAGAIYVVRNPLDLTVSLSSFLGKSIDATIELMANPTTGLNNAEAFELWGSWTQNVSSWIGSPNVRIVKYEDLLNEPDVWFGSVMRYAFDPPPTSDQVNAAVAQTAFGRLKAQADVVGYSTPSGRSFFREGRSGEWREKLTSAQVDRIVANHGDVMRHLSYLPA